MTVLSLRNIKLYKIDLLKSKKDNKTMTQRRVSTVDQNPDTPRAVPDSSQ